MRITASLPQDLFDFVEEEKREQNHDNASRVLQDALKLLKAKRQRQSKYQQTGK